MLSVKIHFIPTFQNTPPVVSIGQGEFRRLFTLDHPKYVELELPFGPADTLAVEFINKDDSDDNTVAITDVAIADINLQHFIYRGRFYPSYNQDWYSKQEIKPPEFYCPGTEMRHSGTWVLDVTTPVFKMVLNNWLHDER
jgi:hypothetical protein